MVTTNLEINIVPADEDLSNILGYDPERCGKTFSTGKEIKVLRTNIGYSILYFDEEFEEMNPKTFLSNIISLLTTNLPDVHFSIGIFYYYEYKDNDEVYAFDNDVAIKVILLNNLLLRINHQSIDYVITNSIVDIVKELMEEKRCHEILLPTVEYFRSKNNVKSKTFELEDDGDEEDNTPENYIASILGEGIEDTEESEDDHYGESNVIRSIGNPKKYYKRHGVLVCKKKRAIKKDAKIIKGFLKDFIPGNSEWKKDFRKDLLDRWMSMYVISNDDLKELEKKHKKKRKNKRYKSRINTNKAIELTKKIFTVSSDRWNDPTK